MAKRNARAAKTNTTGFGSTNEVDFGASPTISLARCRDDSALIVFHALFAHGVVRI
jgi:hypothetical protein